MSSIISSVAKWHTATRALVAATAAVATVVAVMAAATAVSKSPSEQISASAKARLITIARQLAKANGDPTPADVTAVATTGRRGLPATTPGGTMPGVANNRVYVVRMVGHFKGYGFRAPEGAAIPTGKVLSVMINAKTFWVMAIGLRSGAPKFKLAALGSTVNLTWK